MSFTFNAPKITNTSSSNRPARDYDAINEMVFLATTAGKSKSVPGVISGIYDLGTQRQQEEEEEVNATRKYPESAVYFTKGDQKWVRYQKRPARCIAIAVDFPQWTVDYGVHYQGVSNPTPYRALLNGVWPVWDEAEGKKVYMVRGFSLGQVKHDDLGWGFMKNHTLHKLAEAADLLDERGLFTKERVGELLGKCVQFQVKVELTPSADGSRKYLNERVKVAGIVPEGLPLPELSEEYFHGANFHGDNDPEILKKVRPVILNTIKKALDYSESDIKAVIESIENDKTNGKPSGSPAKPIPTTPPSAPRPKPSKPVSVAPEPAGEDEWADDESPF